MESTAASQASTAGSSSADPLAAGETIDEKLAANDPPKLHEKRKYTQRLTSQSKGPEQ